MKATSIQSQIREALEGVADTVSRKRNGNILIRRGFYYRHGVTSDSFANRVSERLDAKGIRVQVVDHYEHWTPFKGGASVAKSSHFGVELAVDNP